MVRRFGTALLALCLLFPAFSRAQDTTNGLAGFWTFDEASGTAQDGSIYGNGMNVGSTVRTTGLSGNGLLVTSAAAPIVTLTNLGTVGEYTLAFSVKYLTMDTATYDNMVVWNPAPLYLARRNSTTPTLSIFPSSNGAYLTSVGTSITLSTNVWYNLCMTRSNTNLSIYLDGNLKTVGNRGFESNILSSLQFTAQTTSTFVADELRLYKRALSSNDVASFFTTPPFSAITNATNGSSAVSGMTLQGTNGAIPFGFSSFRMIITNLSGAQVWNAEVVQDSPTNWHANPTFPSVGNYDVFLVMTNNGTNGSNFMSPPTRVNVVSTVRLNIRVMSTSGAPVSNAQVTMYAPSPNESGSRYTDGTGLATFTNMLPFSSVILSNFAPTVYGGSPVGTNWIISNADDTIVWTVTAVPSVDNSLGLVGSWSFEEASGAASDSSGYGNSMVIGSSTLRTNGISGKGLLIHASTSTVASTASVGPIGDYSLVFSVKYLSMDLATYDNMVVWSPAPMFLARRNATTGALTVYPSVGGAYASSFSSPLGMVTNVWYTFCITRSNSNISVYQDGVLTATASRAFDTNTITQIYFNASTTSSFIADELKFYKRALASNEVVGLYSTPPVAAITNMTNGNVGFAGITLGGTNTTTMLGFSNFRIMISNESNAVVYNQEVVRDTEKTWRATPSLPGYGNFWATLYLTNNGSAPFSYASAPFKITLVPQVRLTVRTVTTTGVPVAGARIWLVSPSPNDSGIRISDGSGIVTYTNMMPFAQAWITNYYAHPSGGVEIGTNFVLAGGDSILDWFVPPLPPTPSAPTLPPENMAWLAHSSGDFRISVVPYRLYNVMLIPLNGGMRQSIFSGFVNDSSLTLRGESFKYFRGGVYVLEIRGSGMTTDDQNSSIARRLLFLVR